MTCSQCERPALPEHKCFFFVLCSASGKQPLARLSSRTINLANRMKWESILCLFAEAELSLGGLQRVCVLVFFRSSFCQSSWAPPSRCTAAETNLCCVHRGRREAWSRVSLTTLAWSKLELLALTIFAASLSFSPIIDLIKHDYQHCRASLLWLFVSISFLCFCFNWKITRSWNCNTFRVPFIFC